MSAARSIVVFGVLVGVLCVRDWALPQFNGDFTLQENKGLAYVVNYGPGTPSSSNVLDCAVTAYDSTAFPACSDAFAAAVSVVEPLGDYASMVTNFDANLCGPTVPGSYICTFNATIKGPCPGFETQARVWRRRW